MELQFMIFQHTACLYLLISQSYCVGGYIPRFTFIVHYVCGVNFQNHHSGLVVKAPGIQCQQDSISQL